MQNSKKHQKNVLLTIITTLVVLFGANATASNQTSSGYIQQNDILLWTNQTTHATQTQAITQKINDTFSEISHKIKNLNTQTFTEKEKLIAPIAHESASVIVEENKNTFVPFDDCARCYAVNVLKERNIIQGHKNKFYPRNEVHNYMLIKTLLDAYRMQANIPLDSKLGLTPNPHFTGTVFSPELYPYFNSAYELGMLPTHIKTEKDFNKATSYKDFKYMLSQFATQFPTLTQTGVVSQLTESNSVVTKEVMAEYIVKLLDIRPQDETDVQRYFFDTAYHPHGDAVEQLARLEVIKAQNINFNIDSPASRADFAVMLARSFAYFNNFDLSLINTDSQDIADIIGAPYQKEILYAHQLGFLTYLVELKREQALIVPQKEVTLHEVYHILSKATEKKIEYDKSQADKMSITRGELAQLFVTTFDYESPRNYQKEIISKTPTQAVDQADNQSLSFFQKLEYLFALAKG